MHIEFRHVLVVIQFCDAYFVFCIFVLFRHPLFKELWNIAAVFGRRKAGAFYFFTGQVLLVHYQFRLYFFIHDDHLPSGKKKVHAVRESVSAFSR